MIAAGALDLERRACPTLVSALLAARRPSAVPRGVWPVIVDPVNAVIGRRAVPHVGVELLEGGPPLRTHRDAAAAVVRISCVACIQASVAQGQPGGVLGRPPPTMPETGLRVIAQAATRKGVACTEMPDEDRGRGTAVAPTGPSGLSGCAVLLVTAYDGQATESTAGEHGDGRMFRHSEVPSGCHAPGLLIQARELFVCPELYQLSGGSLTWTAC